MLWMFNTNTSATLLQYDNITAELQSYFAKGEAVTGTSNLTHTKLQSLPFFELRQTRPHVRICLWFVSQQQTAKIPNYSWSLRNYISSAVYFLA